MAEPLEFDVDHSPTGASVVRVRGRIDGRTARTLLEKSLLVHQPGRGLILNLAGVTFLSSAGVGVLMVLAERLGANGDRLALGPISTGVRTVLSLLNLDQFLTILDSEDDARRAFGG